MSIKTCRTLQLIAVILFATALLLTLLAIPFQSHIKQIYNPDPAIREVRSIPYEMLISTGFQLLLSVICLAVIASRPSRGGAIALTIVIALLLGIFRVIVYPALSALIIRSISMRGAAAITSHMALSNGLTTFLVNLFACPASILMLLSLGGCIAKKAEKQPEPAI